MSSNSFFLYSPSFTGLRTISKHHMPYHPECYVNDDIYTMSQRSKYVRNVNEWLEKPTNTFADQDDPNLYQNAHYVKSMFDELLNIIDSSNMKIYDHKQFKEDFIHYIYTLSSL